MQRFWNIAATYLAGILNTWINGVCSMFMLWWEWAPLSYQEAAQLSIIARQSRAAVRRGVKDGSISLTDALRSPVAQIGDMPTYELLLCVPQFSHARLAILNSYALAARVNVCLPVVTLTERQRLWITAACGTVRGGVEGEWVEAQIDKLCSA